MEYDDFMDAFHFCGCSEMDEVCELIIKVLEYASLRDKPTEGPGCYENILGSKGAYYFVAGVLDDRAFIEHGVSIRFPWILDKGKQLLEDLKNGQLEKWEAETFSE